MSACGLDFGTSNSSIGLLRGGVPMLAEVEAGANLMPSAVFMPDIPKDTVLFGNAAVDAYIGEAEGRLMRSLKSILGSSLIDEATQIGRRRVPFTQIIEHFIRQLKAKAEVAAGEEITRVVHGRPVHFVDGDIEADKRAQNTLEAIAKRVGFEEVVFVYEPIAAAAHYEETVLREETVLIADIGGGTSDFTVIRIGPGRRGRLDRADDVLANAGVRIGGTDFDAALSLKTVMPLLGFGSHLVAKNLPMPKALYHQLATWAFINFAYTARNQRDVRELLADAREPEKLTRLLHALQKRLGHHIAFGVEAAKISLSQQENACILLNFLEEGLAAQAERAGFEAAIAENTARLHVAAVRCMANAGIQASAVDTIFFTGGSSRVPAVRKAITSAAPSARIASGEDMVSVALGLTCEAAAIWGP